MKTKIHRLEMEKSPLEDNSAFDYTPREHNPRTPMPVSKSRVIASKKVKNDKKVLYFETPKRSHSKNGRGKGGYIVIHLKQSLCH